MSFRRMNSTAMAMRMQQKKNKEATKAARAKYPNINKHSLSHDDLVKLGMAQPKTNEEMVNENREAEIRKHDLLMKFHDEEFDKHRSAANDHRAKATYHRKNGDNELADEHYKAARRHEAIMNDHVRSHEAEKKIRNELHKAPSLGQIKEEIVNETLTKSAAAADWIHDFVHSVNPKFKGKSRKERIRMALGAYYGKQNEERAYEENRINEGYLAEATVEREDIEDWRTGAQVHGANHFEHDKRANVTHAFTSKGPKARVVGSYYHDHPNGARGWHVYGKQVTEETVNEALEQKSSGKYYHKNVHGLWGVFHSAEPGRAVDAHDNEEEARERAKSLNREHGLESND